MRRERCAVPGCERYAYHRHHVVMRQHLRFTSASRSDPRNVLLVCGDHHFGHHYTRGEATFPISMLTEANWEFLREVFPGWAEDYVRRYYA